MGQVLFGIVMKADFWLMISACALYLAVAITLGLFISAAVKSQLVANQIAPIVTFLPSMLLSDFVFPIMNMPAAIQVITYIVPARYFIDILKGVYMKNADFTLLWPNFVVLFIMAAGLGALNLIVLKREGM